MQSLLALTSTCTHLSHSHTIFKGCSLREDPIGSNSIRWHLLCGEWRILKIKQKQQHSIPDSSPDSCLPLPLRSSQAQLQMSCLLSASKPPLRRQLLVLTVTWGQPSLERSPSPFAVPFSCSSSPSSWETAESRGCHRSFRV